MRIPALRSVVLASGLVSAAAACGSGPTAGAPPGPSTGVTSTVAATTTPTTPPTTETPTTSPAAYQPSMPAASAAAAAGALLAAWLRNDRVAAGAVATPAAVAALFAGPGRSLQARGCSDGALPITCSYADRSSADGHFYEIDVTPATAGGWFVASVEVS